MSESTRAGHGSRKADRRTGADIAARGDVRTLVALLDGVRDIAYHYAYVMGGSREFAAEAVEAGFREVQHSVRSVGRRAFDAYALECVRTAVFAELRRQRWTPPPRYRGPRNDTLRESVRAGDASTCSRVTMALLAALPVEERDIAALAVILGAGPPLAENITGTSAAVLAGRLDRALEAMERECEVRASADAKDSHVSSSAKAMESWHLPRFWVQFGEVARAGLPDDARSAEDYLATTKVASTGRRSRSLLVLLLLLTAAAAATGGFYLAQQTSPAVGPPVSYVHFAVARAGAATVSVAGDFNGWNPARDRLRLSGATGVWEGWLKLPRGRQRFVYVIDGQERVADPTIPEQAADDRGRPVSVLRVP